jgi:hypothetical protein
MAHGAVSGSVRIWLRLEGLAVLGLSLLLYARGGQSWLAFALLFLAPDLSLAAYAAGPRAGAAGYNLVHSYVGPLLLAGAMVAAGAWPGIALIWTAHIGLDRMMGFGLKYGTAFQDTHLGALARRPSTVGGSSTPTGIPEGRAE